MTIRAATLGDVGAIVAMGARFLASTPYGAQLPTNPEALEALAVRLLSNDDAALLVAVRGSAPVGMIALWAYQHPMSGELVASELVWWVDPEARGSVGVRLLKRAEQWATARGARVLQMIAPTPRVESFYEAVGYNRVEVSYQRRLIA